MLAIFKTGGKQYSVKAGQILKVEKLKGNKGDTVSFNDILAISSDTNHSFGNPLIKGASIKAKIIDQIRDKKIIVFKKRQRQNYRHTQGHRQYLTVLKIESIAIGNKSSTETKKEPKKNPSEQKNNKEKIVAPKKKTAPKKKSVIKKTTTKKKVVAKKTTKK